MMRDRAVEFRLYDSQAGPLPTEEEDRAFLGLIEEDDLPGRIGLFYTRRPSPWRSFLSEGSRVRLASAWSAGVLLTMGVAIASEVWDGGRRREMNYLTSFRVSRRRPSAIRHVPAGYARLMETCGRDSLFLTSIVEENEPARRLLEKRRAGMPIYQFLTGLTTLAMAPGRSRRVDSNLRWRWARSQDGERLRALLTDYGERTPLFPAVDRIFEQGSRRPFVVVETGEGAIRACAALLDQRDEKQYVVSGYRGLLALLQPVSAPLFPLLGYPSLPRVGETLAFRTSAFVAMESDDPALFRGLMAALREAGRGSSFIVAGCTDHHPCASVLRDTRGVRYRSRIYRVYPAGTVPGDAPRCPYVELARL